MRLISCYIVHLVPLYTLAFSICAALLYSPLTYNCRYHHEATCDWELTVMLGYNSKGERLVAGVVALTEDQKYVLLIQSTRRKGWVLPKGGWEIDEECTEAAEREAWEEAGIIIRIDYDLGEIAETRPPKPSKSKEKDNSKALYRFFQSTVLREEADWPEKHKRERQWMTYRQAKDLLSGRPELQEALERSTMKRH